MSLRFSQRIFNIIVLVVLFFVSEYSHAKKGEFYKDFEIDYIDDSINPLEIKQVINLPRLMLASLKNGVHKPESLDFSVWYRIHLKDGVSELNTALTVTIDNPSLDYIHFYLVEDEKVIQQKIVGDTQYTPSTIDYVVPQLSLYKGLTASQTIYVQIKTNGASASPIVIESVASSEFRSSAQLMLLGGFLGVVLIMIIYNYFMFRGIGDPAYINYIGYITFAGLTLSFINGFTFYILPFELAKWLNSHALFAHFSGLAFAVRFAITFLRFNKVKAWYVYAGVYLSRLGFLLAICAFFFPEGTLTPFYFMCVGLVYLYAIILMIKVLKDRVIWVKYYFASWIPLFVGVGVGIAAFNGGVEYNFLTRNAAVIGILSEICLMSMALMDRFKINEQDRDYKTHHDEVTGLPNKIALTQVLEILVATKKMFSIGLFEINEANTLFSHLRIEKANTVYKELFKNIEEYTEGLKSVYKFRRNLYSQEHHIIRINQSRFAVIFLGDLSEQLLEFNLLVMQEAVSTLVYIDGAAISPSCTASVVTYPTHCDEKDQVLFLALHTLLAAKKQKRSYLAYNELSHESSALNFGLAGQLQKAIANDDLQLFHHPQIELKTGNIVGSELLLRWNHNELGYIDTSEIIELADAIGMTNQVTEWALSQGFEQHSKLLKLGFEHTISFNLSVKDLRDNSLVTQILAASVEYKVPPESVIFEFTETITVEEKSLFKVISDELHQQGFKIALDDYGKGHSNLTQLARLPLTQLKLDEELINLDRDNVKGTVIEEVISFCAKFGVSVVAEGVEIESTKELLESYKCELAQGHYFAKPMQFLEYMRWLQSKPQF